MPFDQTNFDYTKVTPVYDKDNPPKRMSEAIRMAVADVEAQEKLGIQYNWWNCSVCTAGAVVRRMHGDCTGSSDWGKFGPQWAKVLQALSMLTCPTGPGEEQDTNFLDFREAFGDVPFMTFTLTDYSVSPKKFKAEMLALADRLEAEGS
ncbi:MAG: hypothetical protein AAFO74_12910 [Pseudomonadota bacterium]